MDTNDLDTERLVARFFSENSVKVDDNGFSRRIMHNLPDRPARLNRLWTAFCATALLAILVRMNAMAWLKSCAGSAMAAIPTGDPILGNPLFLLFAFSMAVSLCSAAVLFKTSR